MERLLWLLECAAVRHQLVLRRRPGRVESLSGRAAKDIFGGKISTATEVFGLIRELYVPNEEFQLAFESHSESSGKKIRYLLAGTERQSITQKGKTLVGELEPAGLTVEHILPKSPSQEWNEIVAQDSLW
jgi:hypothetical protein